MIKKPTVQDVRRRMKEFARPELAGFHSRFFKTGKGEYGEGDRFLGLKVPDSRKVAKEFGDLTLGEIEKLLRSKIHEERTIALMILTLRFSRASGDGRSGRAAAGRAAPLFSERKKIFDFFVKHKRFVNNWDLVDGSAPYISGPFLYERAMKSAKDEKAVRLWLVRMAKSSSLWDRRIAMLSTFYFIRQGRFGETLLVAELLLGDQHDLIHKAVGWMLREVGNRDGSIERAFLRRHAAHMPRTALRYAIEKFPPAERTRFLRAT